MTKRKTRPAETHDEVQVLPGMPKVPDAVKEAAQAYERACEAVEKARTKMEEAENQAAVVMDEHGIERVATRHGEVVSELVKEHRKLKHKRRKKAKKKGDE